MKSIGSKTWASVAALTALAAPASALPFNINFINAQSGGGTQPINVIGGSFYQDPAGTPFSSAPNPADFAANPFLEYDTYFAFDADGPSSIATGQAREAFAFGPFGASSYNGVWGIPMAGAFEPSGPNSPDGIFDDAVFCGRFTITHGATLQINDVEPMFVPQGWITLSSVGFQANEVGGTVVNVPSPTRFDLNTYLTVSNINIPGFGPADVYDLWFESGGNDDFGPDASQSSVTAERTVLADATAVNGDSAIVTVTVRDSAGTPIQGEVVTVNSAGSLMVGNIDTQTDANGQQRFSAQNFGQTVGDMDTVTFTVDGVNINDTVTFTYAIPEISVSTDSVLLNEGESDAIDVSINLPPSVFGLKQTTLDLQSAATSPGISIDPAGGTLTFDNFNWQTPQQLNITSTIDLDRSDSTALSNLSDTSGNYTGLFAIFATARELGGPIFVDASCPGTGNGVTWGSAYQTLNEALDAWAELLEFAANVDTVEIRVAGGTYKPNDAPVRRGGPAQNAEFQALVTGGDLTVLGGFAGPAGSANPDDRDPETWPTTISGDLNDDDGAGYTNRFDNAWRLMRISDDTSIAPLNIEDRGSVTIDGFTFLAGGGVVSDYRGGAIQIDTIGNVTINDCQFIECIAWNGGAIHVVGPTITDAPFGSGLEPTIEYTITNTAFTGCRASNYGFSFNFNDGPFGGAIWCQGDEEATVIIDNCDFTDNAVIRNSGNGGGGGAIANTEQGSSSGGFNSYFTSISLDVRNSNFTNNFVTEATFDEVRGGSQVEPGSFGGAIFSSDANTNSPFQALNDTIIDRCTFTGNSVSTPITGGMFNAADFTQGGAVATFGAHDNSIPGITSIEDVFNGAISNCLFVNNSSDGYGGALAMSSVIAHNLRFYGNHADAGGGAMLIERDQPLDPDQNKGAIDTRIDQLLFGCLFSGNSTNGTGAAIQIETEGEPISSFFESVDFVALQMTFGEHTAPTGTGLIQIAGTPADSQNGAGQFDIQESIFAQQPDGVTVSEDLGPFSLRLSKCIIQPPNDGTFIDSGQLQRTSPLFVSPLGIDGTLGTADDNLSLLPNSPAIDIGTGNIENYVPDRFDYDSDGNTTETVSIDAIGGDRFQDPDFAPDGGEGPSPFMDYGAIEFNETANMWTNPAGGDFEVPGNWSGGVPTFANGVELALSAAPPYTVQLNADTSAQFISARRLQPTLDLGGNTLDLITSVRDSVVVSDSAGDNAEFTVTNGTIRGTSGDIAPNISATGTMTVTGPSTRWLNTANVCIGCGGTGTLRIESGAIVTGRDGFAGDGESATGTLIIDGANSLAQMAFFMVADNANINVTNQGTLETGFGTFLFESATLNGNGSVLGDVINFGAVNPGAPSMTRGTGIGTLTIDGNYEQLGTIPGLGDASGTLNIEIAGETAGVDHDVLDVTGTAALAGGLFVDLPGGYDPPVSEIPTSFDILNANAIIDRFDVAFFPEISGNRFLRLVYGNSSRGAGGSVSVIAGDLEDFIDIDPEQNFDSPGAATFAASGDFDGDGDADLALAIPDELDPFNAPGVVAVLINGTVEGSPTLFIPAATTTYTVGINPSGLAIADFDGDSDLDIAVTNEGDPNDPSPDTVTILENNGAPIPVFADTATIPVGDRPSAIAATDLDFDTMPELAVTNRGDDDLTILTNTSTRSADPSARVIGFASLTPDLPTGPEPSSVDPIDVDNGKDEDDLVISNAGNGTVTVARNMGNGSFDPPLTLNVGAGPGRIVGEDLDNDGLPEIITTNLEDNTISVIINQGGMSFAPAVDLPVGGAPRSVAVVDLDNDQDFDIALINNNEMGEAVVSILRNDLATDQVAFAPAGDLLGGTNPTFVVADDFDGDDRTDLITVNDATGARSAARGAPPTDDDVSVLLNRVPMITTNPSPLVAGQMNTIIYDPTGGFLENAAFMFLRFAYNNESIFNTDVEMTQQPDGTWTVDVDIPIYVESLEVNFRNEFFQFDTNNGQNYNLATTGAVPLGFVMDGELDPGATEVATNGGGSLWLAINGDNLYVATQDAGEGFDRFIYLNADLSPMPIDANWAKAGTNVPWAAFLADEDVNNFYRWFDAAEAFLDPATVVNASRTDGNGGVLEGIIDLNQLFGGVPSVVNAAVGVYGTFDGDPLEPSMQVPASINDDGNLDPGEYVSVNIGSLRGCPADCDGSGGVNFSDLVCALGQFGNGGESPGNCDGNGEINFTDLVCMLGQFGPCE